MSSETTPTSISRSVQPRQPQRPAARTPHPVRHPQQVVRRLPARVARRQGIREQRLVNELSSPRTSEEQRRSWSAEAAVTSRRINTASLLGR